MIKALLIAFAIVTANGSVTRLVPFEPRALPSGQYVVKAPTWVYAYPGVAYDPARMRFLLHGEPIHEPGTVLPLLEDEPATLFRPVINATGLELVP